MLLFALTDTIRFLLQLLLNSSVFVFYTQHDWGGTSQLVLAQSWIFLMFFFSIEATCKITLRGES